ncbi:MAG: Valine-tRNA ligase [Parcubacteria group bacterium GW2011_GWE2_38_18]|nr:MAG: Valine-tRNA ligase [Parcubacteria group bacterium GW2011_GWE2_38_18]
MSKEIAKTYEPSLYEDEIYKKWEESGFFNPDNLSLSENVSSYSISMPPPNVTGTLHMGHAEMLAIQDILIRYSRMKGERTLWVPGTDHAAIATQTKVEKILKAEGTSRQELGKEKFLERVRAFAKESHDIINNQCKKMGSSCDWSREAYTLDEVRSKTVRSVFKLMYDDGLIYRGDRIVNWCPRCHSTLADDEVEYKEQKAKLYTFKYDKKFPFAISTTRPETKLGDTAVAVNPKDERYKEYIGKTIEVNFCDQPLKIKIISDYTVDQDFGTGALGVTPAHSAADWQMAEENDLDTIKVIDEDGNIHAGHGEYSGLSVKEARIKIISKLRDSGLLEKEEEIDNKLSICYRCATPIEPLPSLQWFINVNKPIVKFQGKSLKDVSLEAVRNGVFGRDKINLIPERFEKSYFHWMDNLRDWCISRQIVFGHQIPVWYNSKAVNTSNIYVGVEAPEGKDWVQDEDTLDTWFSSGLWTFSTLARSADDVKIEDGKLVIDSEDFRNFHPTNVMETGYDILFFWVARMIIMTTYALEDIPFQDVYLHGLVRDEKGKKMSKSLGNVIDPLDMIKKYGTDATRLSLIMGSTPGNDMSLSEEKIAGFRNLTNKLWNISRFIETSYGFGQELINGKVIGELEATMADRWILFKFQNLVKEVSEDLDNYRFSQAGERLRQFTWDDLADWYLEVSKFEKSNAKQIILTHIVSDLLKLWHPFMPFVTETIWTEIIGGKMIMIESWPVGSLAEIKIDFDKIIEIIQVIRNARAENKVEPAKKIKAVICAGKQKELIESQSKLIINLKTGIEELEILEKGEKPDNAIFVTVGEIEIYLLGARDEAKEKIRIAKEIENLEKQIAIVRGKLENQEFVERAPTAIIEKEKAKLAGWQSELEKLKNISE